jgi:hypothetical protein
MRQRHVGFCDQSPNKDSTNTTTPPANPSSKATTGPKTGAGAIDELFLDLDEDTTPQLRPMDQDCVAETLSFEREAD